MVKCRGVEQELLKGCADLKAKLVEATASMLDKCASAENIMHCQKWLEEALLRCDDFAVSLATQVASTATGTEKWVSPSSESLAFLLWCSFFAFYYFIGAS